MELSYLKIKKFLKFFSKEVFSYISGNGNPSKIPYIFGNRTFSYFKKQKP